MERFLHGVARTLYDCYGDELSSMSLVFPNRRSRLFFVDELSAIVRKPVWEPHYVSIDEMMENISGLHPVDRVRAIAELYDIYSQYHSETFDTFYFWGEMLLNDFDAIDKYMIDAEMLFSNIRDLRNIEDDFAYLTENQRNIISRFWNTFGLETDYSRQKRDFISIWRTLAEIYRRFREKLLGMGCGYVGMIHRMAAEKIKRGETIPWEKHFAIVGFNALSECEKVLFSWLDNTTHVDFFWDYDDYYVNNTQQEAGLFIRDNIARFKPMTRFDLPTNTFIGNKTISAVSVASDSLQCKYASVFLNDLYRRTGKRPGKETAIVLTDERLLVPLLYSMPECVDKFNVTMGYPLRQSLAYSFVERLMILRSHAREKRGGFVFYHNDVTGLLTHPYVRTRYGNRTDDLIKEIVNKSLVYVPKSMFDADEGLIGKIFRVYDHWTDFLHYLFEVIEEVADRPVEKENIRDGKIHSEFFNVITEHLRKLYNSLINCDKDIDILTFTSLIRRSLQPIRIPYKGEPLEGVQIMGILETRNLDFENILILSMNDDSFPGNPAGTSSFIPYSLRVGYGLPTRQDHDGVYAYYFYRLLQRARRVDLVYNSKSDENSSGEQSRYIYQLEYESPHKVIRREAGIDVNLSGTRPIEVPKDKEVMRRLHDYTVSGTKRLTPTSFYAYLECPLKFYFMTILGLRREESLAEEIDLPMFGTILHRAMELLYTPLIGMSEPQKQILALIGTDRVRECVVQAVNEEIFNGERVAPEEYEGDLYLASETVCRYINDAVLPYDAHIEGFRILYLEKEIGCRVNWAPDGPEYDVRFGGKADRIDLLDNGRIRIVDYKTGSPHRDYAGVAALFSHHPKERKAAPLQTLLYSMMVDRMQGNGEIEGHGARPALYYVRSMNKQGYSSLLNDTTIGELDDYTSCKEIFESLLNTCLAELFDSSQPFRQCDSDIVCQYCDFADICRRG